MICLLQDRGVARRGRPRRIVHASREAETDAQRGDCDNEIVLRWSLSFPIVTCIVISIVLTLALNVFGRR